MKQKLKCSIFSDNYSVDSNIKNVIYEVKRLMEKEDDKGNAFLTLLMGDIEVYLDTIEARESTTQQEDADE